MTISIFHVYGTVDGAQACYGTCADGKTDAARQVQARVKDDGYSAFVHERTERICSNPADASKAWDIGTVLCYWVIEAQS